MTRINQYRFTERALMVGTGLFLLGFVGITLINAMGA